MHIPVDLAADTQKLTSTKQRRGKRAFLAGQSAERAVAKAYDQAGVALLAKRWRGKSGEIDLIFLQDGIYIFCEVKAAPTHDLALERLRPAQMRRIKAAASEYMSCTPKGQLSDVRFDLAVVNGQGQVRILENAFGHF